MSQLKWNGKFKWNREMVQKKQSTILGWLALGSLIAVSFTFQNCGQTPFGSMGFELREMNSDGGDTGDVTVPFALLSADQVFKSMASVTGIAPDAAITTEYNSVSNVLSSGYDLRLLTSPMMIGSANLASRFCNATIAGTTAKERFYSGIDFTKGIENNSGAQLLSEEAYQSSVEKMGQAFWGRMPSSEEFQIISEAKSEFLAEYTPAERQSADSSTKLMLFTCTAMLVSFDAMSF
jgi:hypothetical protein